MSAPVHRVGPALVAVAIATALAGGTPAHAASGARAVHAAPAPRAPDGPPLSGGFTSGQSASASAPPSGEDSLVENGLGSPLCRSPATLPTSTQASCQTADFAAAADPTGDYAFDVNINTGVAAWGNDVSTTTQNILESGWMTFVSVAHGLMVMFEWCYSLDLLSDSLLAQLTQRLHELRVSLTETWLVLVLAIAGGLAAYQGLVRRRISETFARTFAMFAMMACGLWIIADPTGTVGALGQWANQAALGTFATVVSGTPNDPQRVLAGGVGTLYATVVTAPWCYLEFGDVEWCRSEKALDGRLHTAALVIARREQQQSGCSQRCPPQAGVKDRALATSAQLLRDARDNAQLFLALPANQPQRNSVTSSGMLLNVLCGRGESADKCSGPTASQAEFRTQKGTQPRVIGWCLISIGGLGMLLLFGFVALRLLTAAIAVLFYLLLAPAVVLAPALGDGGRAAFRVWAKHLLEAIVSKLTYSFLFGVMLALTEVLLSLTVLGWLAQWLLIAAFWWGAFLKRHQLLGLIDGSSRPAQTHRSGSYWRARSLAGTTATALLPVGWIERKWHAFGPEPRPKRTPSRVRSGPFVGQSPPPSSADSGPPGSPRPNDPRGPAPGSARKTSVPVARREPYDLTKDPRYASSVFQDMLAVANEQKKHLGVDITS